MSAVPSIWIYPHLPKYAGELGIVQFRMNLEARMRSEPEWDRDWRTNFFRAKEGDTVVFAFRETQVEEPEDYMRQWFVVGDAVVFKIEDLEEAETEETGWKFAPQYECFRLYPRNISYQELSQNLVRFRPDAHQVVQLTAEDYARLLRLTVTI